MIKRTLVHKEVKLDIENERLDIYLDFEKGTKFENIDGDYVTAFQTVKRHGNTYFFGSTQHIFMQEYPN
ncbi:MAG: hypothetical protein Q9M97_05340 [Candidatus Gracilibacteria bacterium]|nr:hypothetical protein [Candidatus Gracilibacteria bacterium]